MEFVIFGRKFYFFANEAQFNKFFGFLKGYITPASVSAVLFVALYCFLLVYYKKRDMRYHYAAFKKFKFLMPLYVIIAFKLLSNIGSSRRLAFIVPDMLMGSTSYHESVVLSFIINVALYTPYGYYIAAYRGREVSARKICLTVVLTSLCVEVLQYILASGVSSTSELLSSFVGAAVGLLFYVYYYHPFKNRTMRDILNINIGKIYERPARGLLN